MRHQLRLDRIYAALQPEAADPGPPCDVCGAPGTTRCTALHVVLETEVQECEGCERLIENRTGRPIYAEHLIVLVRGGVPPCCPELEPERG